MDMKPIKTNTEHEAALLEIERLWDAKAGTADGNRLETLTTPVEAYEEIHFPMDMPNPAATIEPGETRYRK